MLPVEQIIACRLNILICEVPYFLITDYPVKTDELICATEYFLFLITQYSVPIEFVFPQFCLHKLPDSNQ